MEVKSDWSDDNKQPTVWRQTDVESDKSEDNKQLIVWSQM